MIKRAALAAAGLAVGIGVAAGVSQAAVGPVSELTTAHVSTAERPPKPKEALATATPAPGPERTADATPAPAEAPTEVPVADATAEAPPEPTAPVEEPAASPEPEPTAEETEDAAAPESAPAPAPAPEAPEAGSSATAQDGFDQRMVALINAERQAAGMAPLQYWGGLRAGALAHSRWMDGNDFEHASDGTMDADTAAAGCSGGWAENIYWASDTGTSPEAAMRSYMESPGHRENILHPELRYVATGTVMTDGGLFNTQRFSFDCA
ncbi:CAP domain-containing protein [Georgenia daeguensis]|uniref:SCP domain-containing protein n=1 Tax=Georgenia daeguensis TaxID=908355 RepID=A0ABP6UJW6_9MICO